MITQQKQQYSVWLKQLKEAQSMAKKAADQQALTGIKDPACKGTVEIPSDGPGNDPKALNLPPRGSNLGEPNKQHDIFDVTKPNGVGQGEYIKPRDGNALDAAAKTPTTPLDKIATNWTQAATNMQQDSFQLPTNLNAEPGILQKLASITAVMLGCEEGRRATEAVLAKRAGMLEAQKLIQETHQTIEKAASLQWQAMQQQQMVDYQMQKAAAVQAAAHNKWYNILPTDFEKQAYAQGAADGEAMAEAMMGGATPDQAAEAAATVTDEDILAFLQALVQSGYINEDEAQKIVQQAASSDTNGDGDISPDELATLLENLVTTGQISPEQATAVAQAYVNQTGGAPMRQEAATPTAPEQAADPAVQAAVAEETAKAASVYNALFNNSK